MSMQIIDYEPKEVYVTIGGVDYRVADRTEKVEKELREHDRKVGTVSQYESDMEVVRILIGKDAAKKLFPKGEDENLDRLYYIASKLVECYRENYNQIKAESDRKLLEPVMTQLSEISEKVKPIVSMADTVAEKGKRTK